LIDGKDPDRIGSGPALLIQLVLAGVTDPHTWFRSNSGSHGNAGTSTAFSRHVKTTVASTSKWRHMSGSN
jgi:hypothetical protein